MSTVYMLRHAIPIEDDATEDKMIGFFSSFAATEQAIAQLRKAEGFCGHPNDFVVSDYEIQNDSDAVFVLFHEYTEGDYDFYSVIGVYSSQEEALEAEKAKKELPPYSRYPDGFLTDRCPLDRVFWAEGFFVY